MASSTQAVPGYYIWETPENPVVIHLSLDVVDRLSAEVMRGFGAVRKRGAEIGGLLTGAIEKGSPTVVRIDGYETVPCEYRLGPSYQFAEEDSAAFEKAIGRHRPVGYFRSHTRDGMSLAPEDMEILDHFFREPEYVALLIKPYAMTASVAGLFVRENGVFPETTPLEFPFRRNELAGDVPPVRRPMMERRTRIELPMNNLAPTDLSLLQSSAEPVREMETPNTAAQPHTPLSWGPAIWITLVCFLLLGGILGFEVARSTPFAAPRDVYTLALRVAKNGDNLTVSWNGQSPLAQAARNGVLEIVDGASSRPIQLDPAQLRNGRLIYRNASPNVRFRLTMNPEARVSITESAEWRQ